MTVCNEIPINIPLEGTLGDDVYWVFNDFTLDGDEYPETTTAKLYIELVSDPVGTNFELDGTFDPESTGDRTKISFKFEKVDNLLAEKYHYDVKVTHDNADVFTHIIGEADIYKDVKNAS